MGSKFLQILCVIGELSRGNSQQKCTLTLGTQVGKRRVYYVRRMKTYHLFSKFKILRKFGMSLQKMGGWIHSNTHGFLYTFQDMIENILDFLYAFLLCFFKLKINIHFTYESILLFEVELT